MESETTFVAPEGVYSMTDEIKPVSATATPAPSSASASQNQYPTKISSVVVRFPGTSSSAAKNASSPSQGLAHLLPNSKKEKDGSNNLRVVREREDGSLSGSDNSPDDSNPAGADDSAEPQNIFSAHTSSADGKKKRGSSRPKHNIKTSSSTFITRMQNAEGHSRTLASKQGEVTFFFYNLHKNFHWVEAGSKAKDPLAKVTFSSFPTCHDVNPFTASPDRLDIIIGFSTGDLIWLDPVQSRYVRLNKSSPSSASCCTSVRWVPGSSTLFLASFADGAIMVFDKEREDGIFTPRDPPPLDSDPDESWDPLDSIFVSMPPWHPLSPTGFSKSDKDRTPKNPVTHWRISRTARITDFVFSPDNKYLGVVSDDGVLRLVDALSESLLAAHASYFGALTAIAWSPDGRFILTGGQDDLLTLFSPWEQRVVARCQGHTSFVSSVAFDGLRCDGRTYRFASVGEDNKLILWDFSSTSLHRPKLHANTHSHSQNAASARRTSTSSAVSLSLRRGSGMYIPSPQLDGTDGSAPPPKYHPAPARNEIAVLQPVLVKHVPSDLYACVTFLPRSIMTSTRTGHIKSWLRPFEISKGGGSAGKVLRKDVDV